MARLRSTGGSWYRINTQQHNADTDRGNVHTAHYLIRHELRARAYVRVCVCAYGRAIVCVLISECRMYVCALVHLCRLPPVLSGGYAGSRCISL